MFHPRAGQLVDQARIALRESTTIHGCPEHFENKMHQQTTFHSMSVCGSELTCVTQVLTQLTSGTPWLVLTAKGASAVQARLMPSHLPNKCFQCSQDCAPGTSSLSTALAASRFASALSWGGRVPRTLGDLRRCTNDACFPHLS